MVDVYVCRVLDIGVELLRSNSREGERIERQGKIQVGNWKWLPDVAGILVGHGRYPSAPPSVSDSIRVFFRGTCNRSNRPRSGTHKEAPNTEET